MNNRARLAAAMPAMLYIEAIRIAPDDRFGMRTWHWFRNGRSWKRTLCDEERT